MKLVNLATLLAVLALNGLAATGAMSGDSIGVLANRYESLFLPANYVFGIWSLIYLGLTASVAYQLLPTAAAARAVERIGPWWVVASVLNVAWISLFSFSRFGAALLVMVAFLVALVLTGARLRAPLAGDAPGLPGAPGAPGARPVRDGWAERVLVRWPFDLYLAWISVALISNTFQFAHAIGWGGFGIAESTWAVAMMIVATVLGVVMAWGQRAWVFPLVVAWALRGIGVRHAGLPVIATAVGWLVPLGIVAGAVAVIVRAERGAHRLLSM
ncbi:MAG: hypothetical protein IPJ78_17220 [Gemmatimonadetes bacterium]|nr:hypothetical protein [Gemmatimonadota bacterium]